MDRPVQEATGFLTTLTRGDGAAAAQLLPLVYDELRRLAGGYFRGQPADHTLQPTALVHEAFMRLIDQTSVGWHDQAHFLAVAATAMRQILIDHAHKRATLKRGGDRLKLSLDERLDAIDDGTTAGDDEADLLRLDGAMQELARLDARKGRVAELRCFGGLTHEQIGKVIGMSKRTVENEWRTARAWLCTALAEPGSPEPSAR